MSFWKQRVEPVVQEALEIKMATHVSVQWPSLGMPLAYLKRSRRERLERGQYVGLSDM